MEHKIIDVDTRTFKEKVHDAGVRVKCGVQDTFNWCVEHKEIVAGAIPVMMAGGRLINTIGRKVDIKREADLKRLYVYDRRNGMYLKLRKPLTNRQKTELDIRRRNGETVAQILNSMRVLD